MDLINEEKYRHQWDKICSLHLITKHYLLIAEELCDDNDIFLQPLKEHRDAYDHIIRIYSISIRNPSFSSDEEKELYIEDNLRKAYGHEYRAFFDTADWLSIICRRYIRTTLKKCSEEKLSRFDSYDDIKRLVNEVPAKIAKLRELKDIGNEEKHPVFEENQSRIISEVSSYCQILDQLYEAQKKIHQEVDVI